MIKYKKGFDFMKEIKVEKDVILNDCYYYLKGMWDEIKAILGGLEFSSERIFYDRVHDLIDAQYLLSRYTFQLELDIIDFKNDKIIDIDSNIKAYNDVCNNVIRVFINKERI